MPKRQYRNKIQKLLDENDNSPFEPTQDDCIKWFRILNRLIFKNTLPLIEFDIRIRRNQTHAYYDYDFDTGRESKFLMNHRYETKKLFVEILAHEMIHHYQFINYEGKVTHGQTFYDWEPRFRKHKLNLKESY